MKMIVIFKPYLLDGSGFLNLVSEFGGTDGGFSAGGFFEAYRGGFHAKIDSFQNGFRYASLIVPDLAFCAVAPVSVRVITAGTWVHGCHQHAVCGIKEAAV
jgi:hypothetical protein